MGAYELSILGFSCVFLALFFILVLIYIKLGWTPCLICLLLLIFGPIPLYQTYDYDPVKSGLEIAHAFFLCLIGFVFCWRAFVIHANRADYDQFITERMGTPSDEELIKTKKSLNYMPGPWMDRIESDLQRAYLTDEWQKRKRSRVEASDPFAWFLARRAACDDEGEDEEMDEEAYTCEAEDIVDSSNETNMRRINDLNSARRERLKGALTLLQRAESIIDQAIDEEKDSMDNMPENLQSSDRYTAMENAVGYLEDAIENVREATGNINDAING